MSIKNSQITIKDIAKALKLSTSTVSRALQGHPNVNRDTKNAVVQLAHQLDYKPNSIALGLRKSKTNTLGIIVPKLVHHFFSSVISGISEVAHDLGYNVIITQTNESYFREIENLKTLLSSRVDAICISLSKETTNYAHFDNVYKREIPLLFFDRVCDQIPTNQVMVDDYQGAFSAVEHLIQMGCRNILHLAGPDTLSISCERKRGYLEAHRHYQLPIHEENIILSDHQALGFETVLSILQAGKSFDGVFAVNDETAIGGMIAAKKMGLKVPSDVAFIGFGNDPIAAVVEPNLSTVRQPGFAMGYAVATIIIDQLLKKEKEIPFKLEKQVLSTDLIIRESSRRDS